MDRLKDLYTPTEREDKDNSVEIDCFADFTKVKNELNSLSKSIDNLKSKNQLIKTKTNTKNDEDEINKLIQKICNDIKTAKISITEFSKTEVNNDDELIDIKKNQIKFLSKKLSDILNDYQSASEEFKNIKMERTVRMIKIQYSDDPRMTDEKAVELAQSAILTDAPIFSQAKDKLVQIIENRNDILKIENSMRELNQIFVDVAILVNEQGEAIVNIGNNVAIANNHMTKGISELKEAKGFSKKGRKKMCCLIVITCIIFAFVLAVVLGITLH